MITLINLMRKPSTLASFIICATVFVKESVSLARPLSSVDVIQLEVKSVSNKYFAPVFNSLIA